MQERYAVTMADDIRFPGAFMAFFVVSDFKSGVVSFLVQGWRCGNEDAGAGAMVAELLFSSGGCRCASIEALLQCSGAWREDGGAAHERWLLATLTLQCEADGGPTMWLVQVRGGRD
ncbi:hypothetical protein DEO72_LG10g3493 [Vigna unguiculata]|uniref:Uncharacterized protein n=1 Tax=Vigna unguiculata TaxID=3917 RepID=A0A4D6NH49_VIGUN|nr:hypothetical protein DEO72_LG10g3493 [Vigna unguiculata]